MKFVNVTFDTATCKIEYFMSLKLKESISTETNEA